ncbi:MAG: hypothetical protein SH809_14960 [Rhodothermales bacterium]|nr:hypothetical protein [Rhodothermales bacterium]
MLNQAKSVADTANAPAGGGASIFAQIAAMARPVNLMQFAVVTLQLGLVLLVIRLFKIEESSGLLDLLTLVFGGFIVHSWLPRPWRMPFFFGLTVAAIVMVFGVVNGGWLVGVALGMIGLAHLPIPYGVRVALLAGVGAVLVAFRGGWMNAPEPIGITLTILGSMFMFRMVLYLYDMRNEKKKVSIWERLTYFFQLPNIIFPFYPIVDYITFRRTYYNKEDITIYQKGVLWMFRGVFHLILYRVVYYHMSPSVASIQDLGGVLLFIVSSYLLYLRISGLFHLIVGMMCLFGFNLPETHKMYFLASGFNDYWRRINIFWKDFMMKLFFYPLFMRVRHWGETSALVFSTIVVFACTWLLHSYQWFWLQGAFPLTVVDGVYWAVLGVLVAANSVWEAKKGKKGKALGAKAWDLGAKARLALQTVATFAFLGLMWSFWSSESAGEWWSVMKQAGNSPASEFGLVVLALLGLTVLLLLYFYLEHRGWSFVFDERKTSFTKTAVFTGVGIVLVFLVGQPTVNQQAGVRPASFIASLQADRLSIHDDQVQERGYYEQLLDNRVQMSQLWESRDKRPADWKGMVPAGVAQETNTLLFEELFPSIKTVFKRAPLSTNQWRMRDQEYALEKPEDTVRMAMLGKSYEMGWGVKNDQVFEQVTEDRLNAEYRPTSGAGYELFNYSVGGYTVIQYVVIAEEKMPPFDFDYAFITTHAGEGSRTVTNLLKLYNDGVVLPADLQKFVDDAGVTRDMVHSEQQRRLDPLEDALVRWGYDRLLASFEAQGVTPVWLFIPRTLGHREGGKENTEEFQRWSTIAQDAGFEHVWSLVGVFDEYTDESQIQLAEWDTHPNALGHNLLGQRFAEVLMAHPEMLMPGGVLAGAVGE